MRAEDNPAFGKSDIRPDLSADTLPAQAKNGTSMSDSKDDKTVSKLGINLEQVQCPGCGEQLPSIRMPKHWHELMWGGWTCPNCGCRMDKWGKAQGTEET